MGLRRQQLENWVKQVWPATAGCAADQVSITPVSGDASFRRYFRARAGSASLIAVDAPPEKEDSRPFVSIARRWYASGIAVPEVIGTDLGQGFMLLEDFGDRQLLTELQLPAQTAPYAAALDTLLTIQQLPAEGLPPYDAAVLQREMDLFGEWFVANLLGHNSADWQPLLREVSAQLIDSALMQPQVIVHRDFHSRNLMPLADGRLGVVDFQDALIGAVTYDLVSLLRDSYIRWPDARVATWVEHHRQALLERGLELPDQQAFLKWFDLMGMQRQLKVLGIFARLWLRDGKPGYLKDIPRTYAYLLGAAQRYPEFAALAQRLEELLPELRAHELLGEGFDRESF